MVDSPRLHPAGPTHSTVVAIQLVPATFAHICSLDDLVERILAGIHRYTYLPFPCLPELFLRFLHEGAIGLVHARLSWLLGTTPWGP